MDRPPKKPVVRYHDFMYRAGSWDRERRIVAKVELHQTELFAAILDRIQRFGVPPPLLQRG
ncbi:MAG: transposase [Planctomycetes bacterium]|nr:transposase [Planctomycetota bacterium]